MINKTGHLYYIKREKGLIFLYLKSDMNIGNENELGDDNHYPGKSSLFFLTVSMTLESYLTEIGLENW